MRLKEEAAVYELALEFALHNQLRLIEEYLGARLVQVEELHDGPRITSILPIDYVADVVLKATLPLFPLLLVHKGVKALPRQGRQIW